MRSVVGLQDSGRSFSPDWHPQWIGRISRSAGATCWMTHARVQPRLAGQSAAARGKHHPAFKTPASFSGPPAHHFASEWLCSSRRAAPHFLHIRGRRALTKLIPSSFPLHPLYPHSPPPQFSSVPHYHRHHPVALLSYAGHTSLFGLVVVQISFSSGDEKLYAMTFRKETSAKVRPRVNPLSIVCLYTDKFA